MSRLVSYCGRCGMELIDYPNEAHDCRDLEQVVWDILYKNNRYRRVGSKYNGRQYVCLTAQEISDLACRVNTPGGE